MKLVLIVFVLFNNQVTLTYSMLDQCPGLLHTKCMESSTELRKVFEEDSSLRLLDNYFESEKLKEENDLFDGYKVKRFKRFGDETGCVLDAGFYECLHAASGVRKEILESMKNDNYQECPYYKQKSGCLRNSSSTACRELAKKIFIFYEICLERVQNELVFVIVVIIIFCNFCSVILYFLICHLPTEVISPQTQVALPTALMEDTFASSSQQMMKPQPPPSLTMGYPDVHTYCSDNDCYKYYAASFVTVGDDFSSKIRIP